ncbi:hypothetical protein C8Q80DRAFT_735600 [Daedaleopsis nitida]|nr:hypothetical protein C8Q80DRAFT_735600 [Daedaleopsis nitida]
MDSPIPLRYSRHIPSISSPLSSSDSDDGAQTPCSTLVDDDGASPDPFPSGSPLPCPSTPSVPYVEPSPIDVLRVAGMRGDLADLPQRISNALSSCPASVQSTGYGLPSPNAMVLQQLVACLSALGVDFSAARAALDGTGTGTGTRPSNGPEERCTRCARTFRQAENHSTACQVVVPQFAVPIPGQPGHFAHRRYVGQHTTSPKQEWAHVDLDLGLAFEGAIWSAARSQPEPQPQPGPSSTALMDAAAGIYADSQAAGAIAGSHVAVPGYDDALPLLLPPSPWPHATSFDACARPPETEVGVRDPSADFVAWQRRNGAVPAPRIVQTIPWNESSLYHPPGWIEVPSVLRRHPGDPWYV